MQNVDPCLAFQSPPQRPGEHPRISVHGGAVCGDQTEPLPGQHAVFRLHRFSRGAQPGVRRVAAAAARPLHLLHGRVRDHLVHGISSGHPRRLVIWDESPSKLNQHKTWAKWRPPKMQRSRQLPRLRRTKYVPACELTYLNSIANIVIMLKSTLQQTSSACYNVSCALSNTSYRILIKVSKM